MRAQLSMVMMSALAVAGCGGGTPDQCAGVAGTCVSLTVTSRSIAEVDALTIVASGIADGTRRSSMAKTRLPVGLAVSLPTAASGRLQLDVAGELDGVELGRGGGGVEVVAGQHAMISVELVGVEPPTTDMATQPTTDFAALDLSGACTSADDGCADATTLKRCRTDGMGFDLVTCAGGCATTPAPHCRTLVPTAPATKSDLTTAGLDDVTITGEALFNADTGQISGTFTRAANVNQSAVEVKAGVAYHQTAGTIAGVFTFHSLTVAQGATLKVVTGAYPIVLVAQTTLTVNGVIDVRPIKGDGTLCPTDVRVGGPGGGAGGASGSFGPTNISGMPGVGPGAGGGGQAAQLGNWGGGGGAGYAAAGSVGNQGCRNGAANTAGGTAGPAYGSSTVALRGGSGGGGGGHAIGGGGGGAIALVAGEVLTIGNGAGAQGVNAGGCGGVGIANGSGGGGSGGTILVEAPVVQLRAMGTLAANGGGGGAYSSSAIDGQAGKLSADPAYGGGSTQFSTLGANGGAGATLGGGAPTGICTGDGFGGAGATGRIYVNAAGATPSINPNAVLSPTVPTGATVIGAATLE